MTTQTLARPRHDRRPRSAPAELRDALRTAADAVAAIDLDDPVWDLVGPLLTELVNQVRAAVRGVVPRAEPVIARDEDVAPVLRVRDLAHIRTQLRGASDATTAPGSARTIRRTLRQLTMTATTAR